MSLGAGDLDREIVIRRATKIDDGFSKVDGAPTEYARFWSKRRTLGAVAKLAAGQAGEAIPTLFVVRYSEKALSLLADDTLVDAGQSYRITGVREDDYYGRRVAVEISAVLAR